MTYPVVETSVETGAPVELYIFTLGGDTFRLTSGPDTVTYSGLTYTPIEVTRENVSVSRDERSEILEITMPSSFPLVRKYISIAPGQRGSLTILRVHRTDTDNQLVTVFKGVIRSVGFTFDGLRSKISVMPLSGALSRPVPRHTYQGLCNHVLYDTGCQVPSSLFRHTAAVTGVVGDTLTVSGLSAKGSGWATGGYVTVGSLDFRLIIQHTGDDIRLLLPFPDNLLGQTVDVFAGCAHDIATCKSKFNNVINYGGYAFVPLRNPFETGLDNT